MDFTFLKDSKNVVYMYSSYLETAILHILTLSVFHLVQTALTRLNDIFHGSQLHNKSITIKCITGINGLKQQFVDLLYTSRIKITFSSDMYI